MICERRGEKEERGERILVMRKNKKILINLLYLWIMTETLTRQLSAATALSKQSCLTFGKNLCRDSDDPPVSQMSSTTV